MPRSKPWRRTTRTSANEALGAITGIQWVAGADRAGASRLSRIHHHHRVCFRRGRRRRRHHACLCRLSVEGPGPDRLGSERAGGGQHHRHHQRRACQARRLHAAHRRLRRRGGERALPERQCRRAARSGAGDDGGRHAARSLCQRHCAGQDLSGTGRLAEGASERGHHRQQWPRLGGPSVD